MTLGEFGAPPFLVPVPLKMLAPHHSPPSVDAEGIALGALRPCAGDSCGGGGAGGGGGGTDDGFSGGGGSGGGMAGGSGERGGSRHVSAAPTTTGGGGGGGGGGSGGGSFDGGGARLVSDRGSDDWLKAGLNSEEGWDFAEEDEVAPDEVERVRAAAAAATTDTASGCLDAPQLDRPPATIPAR